MSVASALRSRSALWHDVIDSFGYRALVPRAIAVGPGELRIRAVRPLDYAGPAAVIDVHELWAPGGDPDGLGPEHRGFHLLAS